VLDKAEYSAFESTLNSTIASYRIVRSATHIESVDMLCWQIQNHFIRQRKMQIFIFQTRPLAKVKI